MAVSCKQNLILKVFRIHCSTLAVIPLKKCEICLIEVLKTYCKCAKWIDFNMSKGMYYHMSTKILLDDQIISHELFGQKPEHLRIQLSNLNLKLQIFVDECRIKLPKGFSSRIKDYILSENYTVHSPLTQRDCMDFIMRIAFNVQESETKSKCGCRPDGVSHNYPEYLYICSDDISDQRHHLPIGSPVLMMSRTQIETDRLAKEVLLHDTKGCTCYPDAMKVCGCGFIHAVLYLGEDLFLSKLGWGNTLSISRYADLLKAYPTTNKLHIIKGCHINTWKDGTMQPNSIILPHIKSSQINTNICPLSCNCRQSKVKGCQYCLWRADCGINTKNEEVRFFDEAIFVSSLDIRKIDQKPQLMVFGRFCGKVYLADSEDAPSYIQDFIRNPPPLDLVKSTR